MGAKGQRDDLIGSVHAALDREIAIGAVVVVAVSGGPDSVALLRLVAAARPDLDLVVGHVRHGLRDDAPDASAARSAAESAAARFAELPVDASGGRGDGPEDRARRARLGALVTLAAEVGAAAILLGHTADDQAETVLLRVARGTGPDGLAGMRPRATRDGMVLLRPLLGLRRSDVRGILAPDEHVTDPTNTDPQQRRARARAEALPALGRLRPGDGDAVPALVRLAGLAADDADLLDHLLAEHRPRRFGMAVVVVEPGTGPAGSGAAPAHVRAALAARLLRTGWRTLPDAPPPPSAATLDTVLRLSVGDRADVAGGVGVDRLDRGWALVNAAHPRLPETPLTSACPVRVPGHDLTYHRGGTGLAVVVVGAKPPGAPEPVKALLRQYPHALRNHVPLVRRDDGTVLMVGATEVEAGRRLEGGDLTISTTGKLRPVYPESP